MPSSSRMSKGLVAFPFKLPNMSMRVVLCTTQYYSVLQSTTPVVQSTTPILLYYKLLQYYSVLQSTSPVLRNTTPVPLCSTRYFLQRYKVLFRARKSTTPILLLQSTSPVLLRTTKYYSSTTLYSSVLLQQQHQ